MTLSATLLRSMRLRIEGTASDMRMAAMAIVTIISINVKPPCPSLARNASGVRKQNSRFIHAQSTPTGRRELFSLAQINSARSVNSEAMHE
ncbi:hypothetical protein J7E70_29625 [Variovorax paradoxus]|nr:hypothetical protein [Variovorax paradoxus]MBT2304586.1 hypothetical protein [Variovorax paradoxus]